MTKIKTVGKYIVVDPIKEEEKVHGFSFTEKDKKQQTYDRGVVKAIGDDPSGIKVGDTVYYMKARAFLAKLPELSSLATVLTTQDVFLVLSDQDQR